MKWQFVLIVAGITLVGSLVIQQGASLTAGKSKASSSVGAAKNKPTRTKKGLRLLYNFNSTSGAIVKDRSGRGKPLDLRIADRNAVHRINGGLEMRRKVLIRSEKPASDLINAVRKTGEITIEAWIRPARSDLSGPARIVTLSRDTGQRNFTLGQDKSRFDVRLRTTKTTTNGLPSLSSPPKSLKRRLTHVVYTRNRAGMARIYIDGRKTAEFKVAGAMSNWDGSYRLALANEHTKDRPWLGTYYLVAIYDRALSSSEVEQNFAAGHGAKSPPLAQKNRVRNGLELLYDFKRTNGVTVNDRSGVGTPLDLQVRQSSAVKWHDGSLHITAPVLIASRQPAQQLTDAVKKTGSLTLEAWITPGKRKQGGPARIVSLSANPSFRNFTLGQDGAKFDVRLRTTRTSTNGIPSLSTPAGSVTTQRTHVVYTFDSSGMARIYLNGKQVSSKRIAGNLSNWDRGFRLALANEMTSDRPWLGQFHLVAVYHRALSANEVAQNFAAGTGQSSTPPDLVARAEDIQHFKKKIAPLLAKHCLECHGWNSKRGRLDLSRKTTAFANGKIIVPGNAENSRLWRLVKSGAMPRKRPPLTAPEKNLLRSWIERGAVWSIAEITPSLYPQSRPANSILVRRLTVPEYIETVRSAVGVDIEKEAHELLPPDLRADGFSNTAYNLTVDLKHVEAYAKLARIITGRMNMTRFAARFTKNRKHTDGNMRTIISKMGRWLLRGPLDKREIAAFLKVSNAVKKEGGKFDKAVHYVCQAMLQSPRFIYRIEKQRGDGKMQSLDDFELAARLSYILWGGPPDKELMRAAEAGKLSQRDRVKAQVQRMLKDPRVVKRSEQFVADWLDLDRLENLNPNRKRFKTWSKQLAADMRDETVAFFKEVVWKQKRPLSDLLNAQMTYLTPRLARHYGLKPRGQGNKLVRYDLSSVPGRGGLLTQGSVLTVGGDDASMVARGLFILRDLLDSEVGDPPPGVDTTPVPPKRGLSQRAISMVRLRNASCVGCHSKFEPLAFGLEKFDGLGSYHVTDEYGNKLRDDGKIRFPGAKKPISYKSSADLMNLLANSDRVKRTLTRKIVQFSLGRPLRAEDEPILEEVHRSAWQNGGTYESVLTAIVMSDLVQKTRTERSK